MLFIIKIIFLEDLVLYNHRKSINIHEIPCEVNKLNPHKVINRSCLQIIPQLFLESLVFLFYLSLSKKDLRLSLNFLSFKIIENLLISMKFLVK